MPLLKRVKALEQVLGYAETEPVFITVKPPAGYEQAFEPVGIHLIWDKHLSLDRLPDESLDAFTDRAHRELVAPYCSKFKPSILCFEYPDLSHAELAEHDIGVTIGKPRERIN